jgi:hypothetical protein
MRSLSSKHNICLNIEGKEREGEGGREREREGGGGGGGERAGE